MAMGKHLHVLLQGIDGVGADIYYHHLLSAYCVPRASRMCIFLSQPMWAPHFTGKETEV